MGIYFFACGLSMLIAEVGIHIKTSNATKKKRLLVLLSSLPLAFFAAVRYGIGTDYWNYVRVLDWMKEGYYYKEYLYNFLNNIVIYLNLNYQWIFVITSFIFCWFVYAQIFEESPYPVLSIFLLVGMTHYFAFYNIMRQMLAAAIVAYAIRYIEKRNLRFFVILIVVAAGFHFSAITVLPLYWLADIKISFNKLTIITITILLFENIIYKLVLVLLEKTRYAIYLGKYGEQYFSGEIGYTYIFVQLAILILAYIGYKENCSYRTYLWLQILNLWIALFSGKIVMIERFRYLYGLTGIILIPKSISNLKNNFTKLIIMILIYICFTIYCCLVTLNGNHGVLPYQSIFYK